MSSLLEVLFEVLWHGFFYILTPRVFFNHLVAAGLLFSLHQQRVELKRIIQLAVLEECVIYALSTLVPFDGFGSVISAYFCLVTYEHAIGVRLEVHENMSFVSDFQLPESEGGLSEIGKDGNGNYCINTGLRCLTFQKQQPVIMNNALELSSISFADVKLGDEALKRSLRRQNLELNSCFSIVVDTDNGPSQTAILVAGSPELKDQWLKFIRDMIGITPESVAIQWLKKLLHGDNDDGEDDDDDDDIKKQTEFRVEDAVRIIKKAGRNVDNHYLVHVFENCSTTSDKGNALKHGIDKMSDFALSRIGSDKGKSTKIESKTVLTFEEFTEFFKRVAITNQVDLIYSRLHGKRSKADCLPAKSFHGFLTDNQRDVLPKERTQDLIVELEPVLKYLNISVAGFSNYLLSGDHSIFNQEHAHVYQDMDQPLSHYFIATSHNTYLTKDQLKSKSSVDAYISVFKRGCKCVELDCWDGPGNEPIIYHGHTLTSKILFRDVIKGIKDFAFCVSDYPVILSFENHCSVEQQIVMAKHLTTILGDKLYRGTIPDEEVRLPSPNDLRGYVIVKAKKIKVGVDETEEGDDDFSDDELEFEGGDIIDELEKQKDFDKSDMMSLASLDEDEMTSPEDLKEHKKSKLKSLLQSVETIRNQKTKDKKVPKLAQELSDLVVYCQATGFKGFEYSKMNSRHFEMSSFGEKKAIKFSKDNCPEFLEYNQRQLSRIYPAGLRIDSSNYNPVQFWNVGCQLVALNYQTACKEMQINQGLFQHNGGCGYVLKPDFMRTDRITFDPRGPFIQSQTLTIRILSGHQLPYKNNRSIKLDRNYQIQVRVYGVDADVQMSQTNSVKNNGYNPTWDEVLLFKVHVPHLAILSFTVVSSSFVAQYSLPFISMKQGFRRIPLLNKHSEPLPNSYLLARIDVS